MNIEEFLIYEVFVNSPYLFAFSLFLAFWGAAFQNLFGLGFGLIVSPLFLFLNPVFLPALPIMLGIASSFRHASTNLKDLNLQHCLFASLGRLFGVVIGSVILVKVITDTSSDIFAIIFAITLIFAVLLSTFARWATYFSPSVARLSFASIISGLMGTITSIGGPPIAIIYRLEPPATARTHLNFLIGTGALLSLIALSISGFVGRLHLEAFVVYVIPVIAGVFFSRNHANFAHKYFKTAIFIVILISALAILVKTI